MVKYIGTSTSSFERIAAEAMHFAEPIAFEVPSVVGKQHIFL